MPMKLTYERLLEVLDYDSGTGVFRWRERPGSPMVRTKAGDVAGWTNEGYRKISIDGIDYREHHLAWLYVHGVWPPCDLDHRNGVRDDNRIVNLREDPEGQNNQNRHGTQRNNTSGFPGVNKCANHWQARIWVDGVRRWLGGFATAEEAGVAYREAKQSLHPFWVEGV